MAGLTNGNTLKAIIGFLVALLCGGAGWLIAVHVNEDHFQTMAINEIRVSIGTIAEQFRSLEAERRMYWAAQAEALKRLEERVQSLTRRLDASKVGEPFRETGGTP